MRKTFIVRADLILEHIPHGTAYLRVPSSTVPGTKETEGTTDLTVEEFVRAFRVRVEEGHFATLNVLIGHQLSYLDNAGCVLNSCAVTEPSCY